MSRVSLWMKEGLGSKILATRASRGLRKLGDTTMTVVKEVWMQLGQR